MFSIGSVQIDNRLIMAPMAGITDLPFRLMIKGLGAGLVTTEMVSAEGLVRRQQRTQDYLKSHPEEKPLAVQIFGARPETMAEAARIAARDGADIVDINMGCPVRKVVKTGAGAALLRDPERVKGILSAVRPACPVPLTVKIRAGWSPGKPVAAEIAALAEDLGADAVTVHPRYATQGFGEKANWDIIAQVKSRLGIPCIGNGDVCHPSHAAEMRRRTGCDGVMVGRAAVGNPWLFRQIIDLERGRPIRQPGPWERRELILAHFRRLSLSVGEGHAARRMRGLLYWYTKGLPHSSRFRGEMNTVKDRESLVRAMDAYFTQLEALSS
jgi:nifR3 family TIM-barrel protein